MKEFKEFRSSGVQEFRSSGVQEFRSSGVQGGELARIASKKLGEEQDSPTAPALPRAVATGGP
jgi:hypothetical protein